MRRRPQSDLEHEQFGRPRRRARAGRASPVRQDGIGADMFAESKAAYFRARDGDVFFPFGWPLQRMAEGHQRAGQIFGEPLLGTLTEGAPADLVVLDASPPTPLDAGNLGGHWSFGFD